MPNPMELEYSLVIFFWMFVVALTIGGLVGHFGSEQVGVLRGMGVAAVVGSILIGLMATFYYVNRSGDWEKIHIIEHYQLQDANLVSGDLIDFKYNDKRCIVKFGDGSPGQGKILYSDTLRCEPDQIPAQLRPEGLR